VQQALDRGLAASIQAFAEDAEQAPVAAGDRHRRRARREEHVADRQRHLLRAVLVGDAEDIAHEDLVGQRLDARQQAERPVARPALGVLAGEARDRVAVRVQRLGRERGRDGLACDAVPLLVGAED
jgi:hypothetical protein